jgi:hypothetical protein
VLLFIGALAAEAARIVEDKRRMLLASHRERL